MGTFVEEVNLTTIGETEARLPRLLPPPPPGGGRVRLNEGYVKRYVEGGHLQRASDKYSYLFNCPITNLAGGLVEKWEFFKIKHNRENCNFYNYDNNRLSSPFYIIGILIFTIFIDIQNRLWYR